MQRPVPFSQDDPAQRELFPQPTPPRPTLRLFDNSDDPAGEPADYSSSSLAPQASSLSPEMTLLEFYSSYVRPICILGAGLSAGSLKQYNQTTELWARFTGDPPLSRIDEFAIARFLEGLRSLPGNLKGSTLGEATLRKHCIHLQSVLDRAGPKGRSKGGPRSRRGAGLLEEPPLIEKPPQKKPRPKNVWTLEEIGLALDACHFASTPSSQKIPAAVWWQSLLLVVYNCGLRIGAAMSLRFSWIERDEFGSWINIPKRVAAPWTNKSRRDLKPYLNLFALAAIERMREADGELIFPWPCRAEHLHRTRNRIWQSSKLADVRRWGFHAIRKRANTEMQRINPSAAKMFMGHSDSLDVNLGFYTAQEILSDAAKKLPQPRFTAATGSRQLELF